VSDWVPPRIPASACRRDVSPPPVYLTVTSVIDGRIIAEAVANDMYRRDNEDEAT
jgi:hypothetical protein